ncbi:hypothetical protein SLA2020_441600 [Shorea laevis]
MPTLKASSRPCPARSPMHPIALAAQGGRLIPLILLALLALLRPILRGGWCVIQGWLLKLMASYSHPLARPHSSRRNGPENEVLILCSAEAAELSLSPSS